MKSTDTDAKHASSSFQEIISHYVLDIESLNEGLYDAMQVIERVGKTTDKQFEEFVKRRKIKTVKKADGRIFSVEGKYSDEFEKRHKLMHKKYQAYIFTPRSFVASFISQFEYYLRNVLRRAFEVKPELINSSGREIGILRLRDATSIKELLDEIVNDEVDKIVSSSPKDLLNWFGRLGIDLKELRTWKEFVEIKLRRNLFIHTGGIVNQQYLRGCRDNNINLSPKIVVGTSLDVDPDYFSNAYHVLFEFGFLLGHTLWRKLAPSELDEADDHLNTEMISLLGESHFALSARILEYMLDKLKLFSSEENRLITIVNLCLAHKKMKDQKTMDRIIDLVDWSACNDRFLLAREILRDEEEKIIYALLTKMIAKGEINKEEIRQWPLFDELRRTTKFKSYYRQKFHENLLKIEYHMH